MPLTEQGFDARRFTEIRTQIFETMADNLAVELDVSSDTVLSIITNIFSSSITDVEELAQAVADNFKLDKAEGVYLDDLVAIGKIRRLAESNTFGDVYFTVTENNVTIPEDSIVSDSEGNEYTTNTQSTISRTSCTSIVVSPVSSVGTFSITINGTPYSISYQSNTASSTIVDGLYNTINAAALTDYIVTKPTTTTLKIDVVDKSNPVTVTPSSNLNISSVEAPIPVTATTTGVITPSIDTITTMVDVPSKVQSVTNYFVFTAGREKETDEELRNRYEKSTSISGDLTYNSLLAKLSAITGVTQAQIFQNPNDTVTIPRHSFECVVQGGDEQSIADTIYNGKPLGVEAYGNTTTIVYDYSGNQTSVSWSRPNIKYINVLVTFDAYDEETFPENGVTLIKEAVVATGDALSLGQDVIPQRFLGAIYNSVSGIAEMTVEVGTSISPSSTSPDEVQYSTDRIAIDGRTLADFDLIRVEVVQQ